MSYLILMVFAWKPLLAFSHLSLFSKNWWSSSTSVLRLLLSCFGLDTLCGVRT